MDELINSPIEEYVECGSIAEVEAVNLDVQPQLNYWTKGDVVSWITSGNEKIGVVQNSSSAMAINITTDNGPCCVQNTKLHKVNQ